MSQTTPPRRLLLVDDDAQGLAALADNLAASGYGVVCAANGGEALDKASGNAFDLAIVDMRMPDMSGAQLARKLANKAGCFSLIFSGHADSRAVGDAARDGALGYLTKPMETARLVAAIETALARSREISRLLASHDNLSVALREGREVSMAVGVLMERGRLRRAAAFEQLRARARSERRKVEEVARDLLDALESARK